MEAMATAVPPVAMVVVVVVVATAGSLGLGFQEIPNQTCDHEGDEQDCGTTRAEQGGDQQQNGNDD
jgi:hypothetical protein